MTLASFGFVPLVLASACGGGEKAHRAPEPGAQGGSGGGAEAGASQTDGATAGSGGAAGAPAACTTSASLTDAASCSGRLIGAALSTAHLADADYASAALEFDYVTAESEMKWEYTEPTRDQFAFDRGDQIVDFAEQHGMKVKGHTLVWHNQLASWVSDITDPDDLRAALVNHITQEVEHYRGKVIAWDVVNEAWDPDDPTVLRDTIFSRLLGPSYIDDAFTAARAADPDVKLYYNDYGADGIGSAKADSIYAMVADMKSRDIPIDGVGLQMHGAVADYLTGDDVAANIRRFATLGVEVVISEMDQSLCYGGSLDDQRVKFHDFVAACLSQPNCPAITLWGVTDKYSWLNYLNSGCADGDTPRPLLWDDGYEKKPAYTGVLDALSGR